MTRPRNVVDARADAQGNIEAVRLEGNTNFTSLDRAMDLADRGGIANAHSVRRENAKPHLRTNPDGRSANNLDTLAGDD